MPCHDGREFDVRYETSLEDQRLIVDLKAHNNKLAQFLCSVMGTLEQEGVIENIAYKNKDVMAWWTEHKEFDRKRLAAEAEQERRNQLTLEQRRHEDAIQLLEKIKNLSPERITKLLKEV